MYDIKSRYINHRSISSHEKRLRTSKKGISPERGMQYHFRRRHTHTDQEKLNKKLKDKTTTKKKEYAVTRKTFLNISFM